MHNSFCTIIFLILSLSTSMYSKESLKDTLNISEVVVSAVKTKEKDLSTSPMQTLSRIELDKTVGNCVSDAIKTFSGVTIKDYGGIGGLKTVIVRSLGANHTSVFIDGIQFSNAATGQIDLGKISIDNAESVSLIVGQPTFEIQPAKFYSSANIIIIKSLIPQFKGKNFNFKANLKKASFGLINPSFSIQNQFLKKLYSDINVNYSMVVGDYSYKSKGISYNRDNSDIETFNINAAFVYSFKDTSKILFKSYYYKSERGLPNAIVTDNFFACQRLWDENMFFNLQYKSNETKNFQFLTNVKYSRNWQKYLDTIYQNTLGYLDNRYLQKEYYFSQAMQYRINHFNIGISSDFYVNTLDANLDKYAKPTRYNSLTALVINFLYKKIDVNTNLLATIIREKTEIDSAASSYNILTSSFSLSFKPFEINLRVRFMYKDIFRMPTFNDLYYKDVGNNTLKPEKVKQFNFGLIYHGSISFIDYFSVKTDVFKNYVDDKIVAVPVKNLFVWSMQNIGKVEVNGIELHSTFQTKKIYNVQFFFDANYTFQRASDITDSESSIYKNQIAYIPFETATTKVSLKYKDLYINSNTIFNGYRYILSENNYNNMIPSWWVSDLSCFYNLKIKKTTTRLKVEISNIFNKNYEVIKNFPMPGRAYSASIYIAL